MATLIDTHSHIDLPDFDDIDSVLINAKNHNVEKIVIPSINAKSFDKILQMCDKYEQLFCALGIHPSDALEAKEEDFNQILENANNPNVVAIGECGLDYYWDKTYVDKQSEVFSKQIDLALEIGKPLLIHDRDAHEDTFNMLKKEKDIPVVMHCFSGSVEFAKQCLNQGFYIAVGGVVTFKNAKKIQQVVQEVPLNKLLLETDAPFLTPEPFRGKRNEPAYVDYVAQKIALIKDCTVEQVAISTTENARKVFGF